MNISNLPQAVRTIIDGEQMDFVVKAKHKHTPEVTKSLFLLGLCWTAFISIFIVVFFSPLFFGGETYLSANGIPSVLDINNSEPLIISVIISGLFLLMGMAILGGSRYMFLQEGGYFVGTASRLLHCQKGVVNVTNWEQFSGNIKLKDKGELSNLVLELRTGTVNKSTTGQFVPDKKAMIGIPNVYQIEKSCRMRMEAHDSRVL